MIGIDGQAHRERTLPEKVTVCSEPALLRHCIEKMEIPVAFPGLLIPVKRPPLNVLHCNFLWLD